MNFNVLSATKDHLKGGGREREREIYWTSSFCTTQRTTPSDGSKRPPAMSIPNLLLEIGYCFYFFFFPSGLFSASPYLSLFLQFPCDICTEWKSIDRPIGVLRSAQTRLGKSGTIVITSNKPPVHSIDPCTRPQYHADKTYQV